MDVVLDSNVLFRTLISGGSISDLLFNEKLALLAPQKIKEEFINNKQELLKKTRFTAVDFERSAEILFNIITFIDREEYKEHLPRARILLKDHTKDEDFIALALAKNCNVWTYEKRIHELGCGIATQEIVERVVGE